MNREPTSQYRSSSELHSQAIPPAAFGPQEGSTLYWLGGAGFLLNCRGTIILIDPLLCTAADDAGISEFGLPLRLSLPLLAAEVRRADYVLYSHADADHMGRTSARFLAELQPQFIATHYTCYHLMKAGVDPQLVCACRTADDLLLGDIRLQITPADHPWQLKALQRGGPPFRAGDCCGFILNTPDGRLYFPGDTRLMEEHLRQGQLDLIALDISQCEYHLGQTSAVVLANAYPQALLLPMHYGSYQSDNPAHTGEPEDVFSRVENAAQRCRVLSPGEPLQIVKQG